MCAMHLTLDKGEYFHQSSSILAAYIHGSSRENHAARIITRRLYMHWLPCARGV
jgi:hypothetical protein